MMPIDDDDILRAAGQAPRLALLERAAALTAGDRHESYGDPVDNHARIAAIFNAMTGFDVSAREVALMMVAVKLARFTANPGHVDSYVDAMAYLGITFECAAAEGADG